MASYAELSEKISEQEIFNSNLTKIQKTLERRNINWTLVGGLAMKAILGEDVPPTRKNGTVVDIDGLGLGPNREEIGSALEELNTNSKEPYFPEIGIEPCIFGPKPAKGGKLEVLSYLRRDRERFFLGYKEVEVEIDPRTMAIETHLLNGIQVPCLPAKTTLFRYLLRGGILKPKDSEKLVKLENHIVANWTKEPNDSLYREYLEFAEKVREKYPNSTRLYNLFWQIDHLTGDRISGSKGTIYSLIKLFRK